VITVQQFGGVYPYLRTLQSPSYTEDMKIHVAQLILLLLQHGTVNIIQRESLFKKSPISEDNQRDLVSRGGIIIFLEVASVPGCLEDLQAYILDCLHVLSPHGISFSPSPPKKKGST